MTGAGISTASGIPDFRSPGTGLYDNLQRYNLPEPTAVFDIDFFLKNPRPFFELAKELVPTGKYFPNESHFFIKILHDKGVLKKVYTQNIDGLERVAKIPENKLVEAHGTFATAKCIKCKKKYKGKDIKKKILDGRLPRCDSDGCRAVIKPDIVFFKEDLPKKFFNFVHDFPECDLLIIMGTSLEVEPFASLIDSCGPDVPRLLLNRERVGPFKKCRRKTDFAITGDLQKSTRAVLQILEWEHLLDDYLRLQKKRENARPNLTSKTSSNKKHFLPPIASSGVQDKKSIHTTTRQLHEMMMKPPFMRKQTNSTRLMNIRRDNSSLDDRRKNFRDSNWVSDSELLFKRVNSKRVAAAAVVSATHHRRSTSRTSKPPRRFAIFDMSDDDGGDSDD